MRIFNYLSWGFMVVGMILKLAHLPFGDLLVILATLFIFIHGIIFLVKNFKEDEIQSLFYVSISAMTIYLLFRVFYWPCGPSFLGFSSLFLIATAISIYYCYLLFKSKKALKTRQIVFVIYFLVFFNISFLHSYSIYYFLNLSELINAESREYNYKSWDKYSWFLYIANEKDDALEANKEAQNALLQFQANFGENVDDYSKVLRQHEIQIQQNSWNSFP